MYLILVESENNFSLHFNLGEHFYFGLENISFVTNNSFLCFCLRFISQLFSFDFCSLKMFHSIFSWVLYNFFSNEIYFILFIFIYIYYLFNYLLCFIYLNFNDFLVNFYFFNLLQYSNFLLFLQNL